MIVQEDVPYTKEEVKAMVNTIHDLREKVSQLGWHSADEDEPEPYETVVVYCETASGITSAKEACVNENHCWSEPDVQWWCYPPKEERLWQDVRNTK